MFTFAQNKQQRSALQPVHMRTFNNTWHIHILLRDDLYTEFPVKHFTSISMFMMILWNLIHE